MSRDCSSRRALNLGSSQFRERPCFYTQTCFTSRKTSIFAFRVVNADRISSLHSSIAHHSNVPPSRVNSTSFLCFARERRQTKTLIARTMSTHWRELLLLRRLLTFDCMSDVANDDGQEGLSYGQPQTTLSPRYFPTLLSPVVQIV